MFNREEKHKMFKQACLYLSGRNPNGLAQVTVIWLAFLVYMLVKLNIA